MLKLNINFKLKLYWFYNYAFQTNWSYFSIWDTKITKIKAEKWNL